MSKTERLELYMLMREKGIRAVQIAEACDISNGLISRFFSGKANMSLDNVYKLTNFINDYKVDED